mmetsp:Transcript_25114/g.81035  ORF Transcript_25114/g.81035 Transcript_25114/m.81035 type:complete len:218 (-) Transcript_25114:90-743(-)
MHRLSPRVVEHVAREAVQERSGSKAVGADVGVVRDGDLLCHLKHRAAPLLEPQVRVDRRRPPVGEVEAGGRVARERAEGAEHVGEVEVVAVEAEGLARQLGRRHVLQPDEERLDRPARHHLEGDDADVGSRILPLQQRKLGLVLAVHRVRHDEPDHIAQPQLQVVEHVEEHRPACNLDERLWKDVAGLAEDFAAAAHRNEHVERRLVTDCKGCVRHG